MEVDQETVFPPYRHDHSERNSYTKSCGGQITFKNFRENLVSEFIAHPKEGDVTGSGLSRGRPSPAASQLTRLEVKHSEHWPSKGNKQCRCRLCSLQKKRKTTLYSCRKCDAGLCVDKCFEKWHTCVNLGR